MDVKTKYRQAILLLVAAVSMVFTILLYYRGSEWLIPALVSYAIFGLIFYWGNKAVFLVPYPPNDI